MSKSAGDSDGWRMRVLVVEDNADTAQILSHLLRGAGHEVEVAFDGETAVAAAKANPPDVVLLEIGLPGMDGWQVAREVQEQSARKKPLLVALAGRDGAGSRRRSEEAGIDLYLVKPVRTACLRQILNRFQRVIGETDESAS